MNLPAPTKKGLVSRTTKPKSAMGGDDSSETFFDIVPYKGGLFPIGNTVLEGSPFSFACTCSSRRSTASKPKPSAPRPSMDASLSVGPAAAKGRHLHHLYLPLLRGEYVISKRCLFFIFSYSWGLPAANSTHVLIHLPFSSYYSLAV